MISERAAHGSNEPDGFLFAGMPWLLIDPASARVSRGRVAAAVALREYTGPGHGPFVAAPLFSDHDLARRYIERSGGTGADGQEDVPFQAMTREALAALLTDLRRLDVGYLAIDPEPGSTRLWEIGTVLAGLQDAIDAAAG